MNDKARVTFSKLCERCNTRITVEGDTTMIEETLYCPICISVNRSSLWFTSPDNPGAGLNKVLSIAELCLIQ
jgi:hypothetical protein